MREQNSGAKVLLRNIFFLLKIVGADEGALLQERAAGASSLVCTDLYSTMFSNLIQETCYFTGPLEEREKPGPKSVASI